MKDETKKTGGLNVLLLFAHNAPSEKHTPTHGVLINAKLLGFTFTHNETTDNE